MRKLIKLILTGAALSVGFEIGRKVWYEFLVKKVDKLKDKFTKQN